MTLPRQLRRRNSVEELSRVRLPPGVVGQLDDAGGARLGRDGLALGDALLDADAHRLVRRDGHVRVHGARVQRQRRDVRVLLGDAHDDVVEGRLAAAVYFYRYVLVACRQRLT